MYPFCTPWKHQNALISFLLLHLEEKGNNKEEDEDSKRIRNVSANNCFKNNQNINWVNFVTQQVPFSIGHSSGIKDQAGIKLRCLVDWF